MYTSHGHQVPGTRIDLPKPKSVARCGGPRVCLDCAKDAAKIYAEIQGTSPEVAPPPTIKEYSVLCHPMKMTDTTQKFTIMERDSGDPHAIWTWHSDIVGPAMSESVFVRDVLTGLVEGTIQP